MRKTDSRRLLGLIAMTGATSVATVITLRADVGLEKLPPVDASASPPPRGDNWPLVSIVVPVRNEERNLPVLLPTLLDQRYPNYEVITVDDQSSDSTPQILAAFALRDSHLKVVKGGELPRQEGWMGKPYAMHQGVQQARGEWLLFTDADTKHSPLSLSTSVAYALVNNVDMLTLAPTAELTTLSEKLLMPIAIEGILILYPIQKVNDPKSKVVIANGQYILIRREVYDQVGGIERVKDQIVEDRELANIVKGSGYRLFAADGRDLASVRMYTNLGEIWEGWSRISVPSFKGHPEQVAFAIIGTLSMTAIPASLFAWSHKAWKSARKSKALPDYVAASWVTALAVWNPTVLLLQRRRVDRMLGLPAFWTFTQPLGVLVFGLLLLHSVWRLLTGKGVTWKGRTYLARVPLILSES